MPKTYKPITSVSKSEKSRKEKNRQKADPFELAVKSQVEVFYIDAFCMGPAIPFKFTPNFTIFSTILNNFKCRNY